VFLDEWLAVFRRILLPSSSRVSCKKSILLRLFTAEGGGNMFFSKRQEPPNQRHSVTSQKTWILSHTVLRNSDPIRFVFFVYWRVTLREEHNLRLFQIIVIKAEMVTGGWRKMHNKEPYTSKCSRNIVSVINSRRVKWAGNVAGMWEKINSCTVLEKTPEERKHLRGCMDRWQDGVKVDLKAIGW
jgi:hypothetical protein